MVDGYKRNIPDKLYWNRFSGFWQEDLNILYFFFLVYYRKKISPAPIAAMFFYKSWQLRTILVEGHQGNILPSYIEISLVVYDKKSFKAFYIDI